MLAFLCKNLDYEPQAINQSCCFLFKSMMVDLLKRIILYSFSKFFNFAITEKRLFLLYGKPLTGNVEQGEFMKSSYKLNFNVVINTKNNEYIFA